MQGSADTSDYRRIGIRYCMDTGYCPDTARYVSSTYLPIFQLKIIKQKGILVGYLNDTFWIRKPSRPARYIPSLSLSVTQPPPIPNIRA
jgi:hypothetical protein